MKILHIVPSLNNPTNGIAVAAKMIARQQGGEFFDCSDCSIVRLGDYDEVWVHSMWLPRTLLACWRVLRAGVPLVRMPHGCMDPVRLRYHGWKKWLVGPIERWCLRRCDRIVATCEAEKGWIEKYLGKRCPVVEVTDVKRFFKLNHEIHERHEKREELGDSAGGSFDLNHGIRRTHGNEEPLHLLYLGRQHPLKGLEYLEEAVKELVVSRQSLVVSEKDLTKSKRETRNTKPETRNIELKIVSNAFGEELEKVWDWCDVLVLPTLSENFGLVVAEALERGKRVITTDGAPAWEEGLSRVERVDRVEGELWSGYGGQLIYLKGYRDGTDEERVELLKRGISFLAVKV